MRSLVGLRNMGSSIPSEAASKARPATSLPAEVRDRLQHLVTGLNALAIELEGALGSDQIDEFADGIDIAGLHKAALQSAQAFGTRIPDDRLAAGQRPLIQVAADLREPLWVNEADQLHLANIGRGAAS